MPSVNTQQQCKQQTCTSTKDFSAHPEAAEHKPPTSLLGTPKSVQPPAGLRPLDPLFPSQPAASTLALALLFQKENEVAPCPSKEGERQGLVIMSSQGLTQDTPGCAPLCFRKGSPGCHHRTHSCATETLRSMQMSPKAPRPLEPAGLWTQSLEPDQRPNFPGPGKEDQKTGLWASQAEHCLSPCCVAAHEPSVSLSSPTWEILFL